MLGSTGDREKNSQCFYKCWFAILEMVTDIWFWIFGFRYLVSDICHWHIQILGDDGQKNSRCFLCWLAIWEMVPRKKTYFSQFRPIHIGAFKSV